MTLAVNEQSPEVAELAKEWPMLDALLSGTRAMREQKAALLPQWPAETSEAYNARLATATLFPAYRRTVGVMSGKPFSKALALSDADARIEKWAEDIDQQGVSLHSFAAEMFEEAVGPGIAGILVDYPKASPSGPRTVAQVESEGLRPYWVRVKKNQILGWKAEVQGGAMALTQLRIAESHEEPDGPYGVKVIPQVRVLEPGRWEIHRQAGQDKIWQKVDEGTTTLNRIPFVPIYGKRDGFMVGRPPLLDLAYLNVKHWQSQSDQDTILHVARVPILSAKGVPDTFTLQVGAASAVNLGDNQYAELKFVEHTGAAIEAGENSLVALRNQMVETGAELLVKRESGDVSATEASNDAEANKSDLQRIAENFADSLDQALVYTAQFASIDVSRAGTVSLFSDYGAATLSDASAQLVLDMSSRGLISRELALTEMKRRGVIEASVDPAAEVARAEAEGPSLGELSLAMTGEAARAAAEANGDS